MRMSLYQQVALIDAGVELYDNGKLLRNRYELLTNPSADVRIGMNQVLSRRQLGIAHERAIRLEVYDYRWRKWSSLKRMVFVDWPRIDPLCFRLSQEYEEVVDDDLSPKERDLTTNNAKIPRNSITGAKTSVKSNLLLDKRDIELARLRSAICAFIGAVIDD